MKKSLLRIAAALLTLVLVFSCCISFNASATGEPTISVIGNNQNPAEAGTETTINLSGINLSSVKGMDLTLNAPSGVSFTSISGNFTNNGSTQITLTENTNYTLTSSKIRIVATFVKKPVDSFSATVVLNAPSTIGKVDVPITFTLVNESVAKMTTGFINNSGELIVSKTSSTTNTGSALAELLAPAALLSNNVFVPYGGIYVENNGSYSYPKKNADGSFDLDSSVTYKYKTFKLPSNTGSITTFSSSKKEQDAEYDNKNGVQFVSYALDRSKTHGTILFKGNFDALFEAKKGTYQTKEALVQNYANALKSKDSGKWFKISYADTYVLACRVDQVKAMWYDSDNESGHIQYALRVLNVNSSEKFTAVGYTLDGNNCYVSDEYQSFEVK